ncbi:MAG TPA: histone deacetylase [Thermoanaerobaculia bacterium]|nr:histone deacetylase [Thermoanaerobaculia bacterium]
MNDTGLVFDERFHAHSAPYEHPESPARLSAIESRLAEKGLLARCRRVPAREASRAEITAVHDETLFDLVESTAARPFSQLDPDTYANSSSALAARLAAGGLVDLTLEVLAGSLAGGFALLRPPGHHAERSQAMGFCLYNNVAIAAAAALAHGASRVLIVDWDLHHGNGTQDIFWNEPAVVYFSTHQAPLYPGTGGVDETGGPAAPGHTINVPWSAGRGDADHLAAFDRLLLPVARKFSPDLILVSAGFDAARGDLLGSQLVSPGGFGAMTARLTDLAGGKVVLALEGGYELEAISASAEACLRVLLGDLAPAPEPGPASHAATHVIDAVAAQHRPFWPQLR